MNTRRPEELFQIYKKVTQKSAIKKLRAIYIRRVNKRNLYEANITRFVLKYWKCFNILKQQGHLFELKNSVQVR